ncbi:MAG: hypothetical protein BWK80_01370 [Desulfobacteraceae bacterium IS3]|nr:MAG: hypothetical protein BWK80_01370 [Desulfobacteraceae bacterium IS3]
MFQRYPLSDRSREGSVCVALSAGGAGYIRRETALGQTDSELSYTNSLSKTVLSVKPLFKRFQRFQRFEKPLYDMKDRSLKANWYYTNSLSKLQVADAGAGRADKAQRVRRFITVHTSYPCQFSTAIRCSAFPRGAWERDKTR